MKSILKKIIFFCTCFSILMFSSIQAFASPTPAPAQSATNNKSTVYYYNAENWDNVYIKYKLGTSSKWTFKKMTASSAQKNYDYVYTISLGSETKATVKFFAQKSGTGGTSYDVSVGTWGIKSHKVKKISNTPISSTVDTPISEEEKSGASAEEVKSRIKKLQDAGGMKASAINKVLGVYEDDTTSSVIGIYDNIKKVDFLESNAKLGSLYDALKVIGYALVTLYAIIALLEKASEIKLTMEQILQVSIHCIFAKIFIDYGWVIFTKFYNVSMNIVSGISFANYNNDGIPYAQLDSVVTEIENNNSLANAMVTARYIGIGIFPAICMFLASVIIWGIMIEMVVRALFSPIAYGEISYSGLHGPGFQYMKKVFGGCLQLACIPMACYVAGFIKSIVLTTDFSSPWYASLIINLTTVFLITKASSMVQDLVH